MDFTRTVGRLQRKLTAAMLSAARQELRRRGSSSREMFTNCMVDVGGRVLFMAADVEVTRAPNRHPGSPGPRRMIVRISDRDGAAFKYDVAKDMASLSPVPFSVYTSFGWMLNSQGFVTSDGFRRRGDTLRELTLEGQESSWAR